MPLLDCTFRDGGYYTNWDFPSELVKAYVYAVNSSGLGNVEIGFRNFPDSEYRGAFYYSPDKYIEGLGFDSNVNIFVMVDASIFRGSLSLESDIKRLFVNSTETIVSGVRIATRIDDLDLALNVSQIIGSLGYRVFLNLMQIAAVSESVLIKAIKKISETKIEVLYFADSLGEMVENDVVSLLGFIRKHWDREIGFHAHNNLGLGVANTITASKNGTSWLDATVAGMGRGAGNAESENLLLDVPDLVNNPSEIVSLSIAHFQNLKKKYDWGASYLYALAAKRKIHPTYIQEVKMHSNFSPSRILDLIEFLSSINARAFNKDLLTFTNDGCDYRGTWDASGWCEGKELLVIGAGSSVESNKEGIEFYIDRHKPIVVSLSLNAKGLDADFIDFYACANEAKILSEGKYYSELVKPIFLSSGLFKSVIPNENYQLNNLDFGLRVMPNSFQVNQKYCVIPSESSLAYILAICIAGGAKKVGLVGFDGFDNDDINSIPMKKLFSLVKEESDLKLVSLTPTNYDIEKGSLYSVF